MTKEQKIKIATEAAAYAANKGLANTEVSRLSGVNAGYVSQIFRHVFENNVQGKPVLIGDTHFIKLATWAGVLLTKNYWPLLPTIQFRETISILESCKKSPRAAMVINDSGMGKTNAVDAFVNTNPKHTFRLTVGDSYLLRDIINELMEALGVSATPINSAYNSYTLQMRLRKIAEKLEDISNEGGKPMIIFDEAENLKLPILKFIKEIYDAVIKYCSIVLIGTSQLVDVIEGRKYNHRRGIPQVRRRFAAGTRFITPLDKKRDFKPFYDRHQINNGIQSILNSIASNYGELHDYLEPAIVEAEEKKQPLTEELFRLRYNIPTSIKSK